MVVYVPCEPKLTSLVSESEDHNITGHCEHGNTWDPMKNEETVFN